MGLNDVKINAYSKPVSALSNNPSQDGISAEELKAWFDSNATNEIKSAINTIVDFLYSFTDGEKIKGIRIGASGFPEITLNGSEWLKPFDSKVDKVSGKGLSANDYTNEDKAAVATIGNKVDKDGNKVLSTNDYTNGDKAIVAAVINKADKTNVIEKNSTVAYTPTAGTHPANKGYVDSAINEKISQLGAGDMSKAVYDPQGKNKDIFAEMNNYLPKAIYDPQGKNKDIFAEMTNYLPKTTTANDIGAEKALIYNGSTLNLYVATTGSDTTGDGTSSKPYASIQKAVDSLPKNLNGKVVLINVAQGTYNVASGNTYALSSAYLHNGYIRIKAQDAANKPTINGGIWFWDCQARIMLENFNIKGAGSATSLIRGDRMNNLFIGSCTLDGLNSYRGVSIGDGSYCYLTGTKIDNCARAIETGIVGGALSTMFCYEVSGSGNTMGLNAEIGIIVQGYNYSLSATTAIKKEGGIVFNRSGTLL